MPTQLTEILVAGDGYISASAKIDAGRRGSSTGAFAVDLWLLPLSRLKRK
jgi:hypothetical protein